MTREEVERQIRELLATETRAVILSNKLYTPEGLFNQIAHTREERRAVVQTNLWRDAMDRLRELQQTEAAALAGASELLRARLQGGDFRVRLEPADTRK